METFAVDDLTITVAESNEQLGVMAADAFARAVQAELDVHDDIAVILATGNSQLSFVTALYARDDIEWGRISVLHMDEYIGMPETADASFRRWMHERIVEPLHPKSFHGVLGDAASAEEEAARYEQLLRELNPVICVMGIGENGHLAFNDPPADFTTPRLAHIVAMDAVSRQQQVNEGHFPSLAETPTHAISLTVPALLAPRHVLVLTPEARKAQAVRQALEGPLSPECPASILRTQPHAQLFLDTDSAAELNRVRQ